MCFQEGLEHGTLKDMCRRLNHHLFITQEAAEKDKLLLFPSSGECVSEPFSTISVLTKAI